MVRGKGQASDVGGTASGGGPVGTSVISRLSDDLDPLGRRWACGLIGVRRAWDANGAVQLAPTALAMAVLQRGVGRD